MKTPKESIEEVIVQSKYHFRYNVTLDQALKEIDAYYKSRVPKKKEVKFLSDEYENIEAIGYNQCVDDFYKEG